MLNNRNGIQHYSCWEVIVPVAGSHSQQGRLSRPDPVQQGLQVAEARCRDRGLWQAVHEEWWLAHVRHDASHCWHDCKLELKYWPEPHSRHSPPSRVRPSRHDRQEPSPAPAGEDRLVIESVSRN